MAGESIPLHPCQMHYRVLDITKELQQIINDFKQLQKQLSIFILLVVRSCGQRLRERNASVILKTEGCVLSMLS